MQVVGWAGMRCPSTFCVPMLCRSMLLRASMMVAASAPQGVPLEGRTESVAAPLPAGGLPHISLRVFDWDLVSADDFLGQCEVPFSSLGPAAQAAAGGGGPAEPRWLPLYGYEGRKKVDAGEIQVAAWFEAGGSQGQQGQCQRSCCTASC